MNGLQSANIQLSIIRLDTFTNSLICDIAPYELWKKN